tara:strand:- start:119 stop:412 length:294 start_codon:yes stop_codon:yes gene_type:complete
MSNKSFFIPAAIFNRLSQRHRREDGGERTKMSVSEKYLDFIYKKQHRKMVWSMIVVAWDRCNIIMPAHKVLCEGYVDVEGISSNDWINPPSGPPNFT